MDDVCEYCGLYGCDSTECILNTYGVRELCGLKGHSKNECSLNKLINNMNKNGKSIVEYIKSNFPDTDIFVHNLYNINPIQKNIIITYKSNSINQEESDINHATLVLTTLDGVSVYKYYYIIYNNGYIKAGTE